ncbi:alpha/beta fold hydrolase [Salibacterium sp. K-3]
MITTEEECFGGVPCLHLYDSRQLNKPLPVLLYWHGFSSAKDHCLHIAYHMAGKGIRVILPDALYHGVREKGLTEKDLLLAFWSIVLQGLQETQDIYENLKEKELLKDGRIFLGGTSMGGIITCGALAAFPWLQGGAVVMGTPAWAAYARRQAALLKEQNMIEWSDQKIEQEISRLHAYDVSRQPELLGDRPIFFWHGKEDAVISWRDSYALYETLKHGNNQCTPAFELDERAGHKLSRSGMLTLTKWTAHHI